MNPRILVAGIGNVFLGDDGFGAETARRLAVRPLPDNVRVEDFGIRGLDLVYALLDPYDTVIFVDAAPLGEPPGTLGLIEPQIEADAVATLDAHGMDPVKVLKLARSLGANPGRVYLVACEPGFLPAPDSEDVVMELSPPVETAVAEAVKMVEALISDIVGTHNKSLHVVETRV